MPYINTTTNAKINTTAATELTKAFGKAISIVSGKNESQLMLAFHDSVRMAFKGDEITPTVMLEVDLFGKSDAKELNALTEELTKIVNEVLGISPDRIYVKYLEYSYWGVGGKNA